MRDDTVAAMIKLSKQEKVRKRKRKQRAKKTSRNERATSSSQFNDEMTTSGSALRHHRLARSLINLDAESLKPSCDAPSPWIEEAQTTGWFEDLEAASFSARIGTRSMIACGHSFELVVSLLHNQTAFLCVLFFGDNPLHTPRRRLLVIARS